MIKRRDWIKTSLAGIGALSTYPQIVAREHKEIDILNQSLNQEDIIRLSHNENPYGPSPAARQAIIDNISKGNRYPRTSITNLKEVIAAKENIHPENVLITAGSTEILGLMGLIYGIQKGNIISGFPTFDYLMSYSKNFGSKWVQIPLKNEMYPMKQIADTVNDETKLVFICNPNNPAGTYLQNEEIESTVIAMAKKTQVFIDEAYIEFTDEGIGNSFAPIAVKNPNVVVGRTFSKIYGMAGLRIGYAIAHKDTISTMMQYFMGRMVTPAVTSVEAAIASLNDQGFAEKSKSLTEEAKKRVYAQLASWGVKFWKSHTNFIWFESKKFKGDIYKNLQKSNIYIRSYSHSPGFARVSIGTLDEVQAFLDASRELLA